MADSVSQSGQSDTRSFAGWLEAWTAGFIAHREGVPDDDGEAIMRRASADFEGSGSQQARRLVEALSAVRDG